MNFDNTFGLAYEIGNWVQQALTYEKRIDVTYRVERLVDVASGSPPVMQDYDACVVFLTKKSKKVLYKLFIESGINCQHKTSNEDVSGCLGLRGKCSDSDFPLDISEPRRKGDCSFSVMPWELSASVGQIKYRVFVAYPENE